MWGDQAFVQKAADAQNQLKQRGFSLKDIPSVGTAAKAVGTSVLGLGKQLWNYANVAGNLAAGAVSEAAGAEGMANAYAADINKRLSSNIAGTEEAMSGLAQLGEKGIAKAGRKLGIAKDFSEYTPAERVTDLFNEVGKGQTSGERLTGKGAFTEAVTGGEAAKQNLNPEEISTLAAGDPFSFYAFGRGASLLGAGAKAIIPAAAREALAAGTGAVARGAEAAIPKVVGKTVTGSARAAKIAPFLVEKTAPIAAPIYGAAAGAGLEVGGIPLGGKGLIGGLALGSRAGKTIARGAREVSKRLDNVADLGRQISGNAPIASAYTQGARDFLQALPSASGQIAKGAAIDLGLAATTAELPQDTEGSIGFGTALGALGAARRVGGRLVSGQLIAPRSYGVEKPVASSGKFSNLDIMHEDAFEYAPPAVRARVNAIRQFADNAAPGTDIFMARDAATMERALVASGVPAETARLWSEQNGVSTRLPDKNGNLRSVILLKDVDAAPHEAFHPIQDILGEEANRKIDGLIKETYAPEWEALGRDQGQRIGGDPANWRETILDATGWGDTAAKEKLYRDIYNEFVGRTGTEPAPRLVEEQVKARLGQIADEAVARGQPVDPSEIGRHVWRDILAPEDIAEVSDRYLAREMAAENFDAVFKAEGPELKAGNQLPQILAQIAAKVGAAFGAEPLAGRVSEIGKLPIRTPVVEAVRQTALGQVEKPVPLPKFEIQPRAEAAAPKFKDLFEPKGPIQRSPELQALLDAPIPINPELVALQESAAKAAPTKAPTNKKPPTPAPSTEAAALEARIIAEEAPSQPLAGGTKSPRELLGQIAESIAAQEGVKLNYLSAPGEPAAAATSNRTARRAVIEAFRSMPKEARALWEKTFFPEKVTKTKSGSYQVQGWAPEVFASNAQKLAAFLAETPGAERLSPYAIDPKTKSFTPDAWQELYRDTQTFVENQARGATGSGEPLVVPRSVTEAGGYAPQVKSRRGCFGPSQGGRNQRPFRF